MESQPEKLKRAIKYGYGTGHIMNDMCTSLLYSYQLLYYERVLKLGGGDGDRWRGEPTNNVPDFRNGPTNQPQLGMFHQLRQEMMLQQQMFQQQMMFKMEQMFQRQMGGGGGMWQLPTNQWPNPTPSNS